ncbi:oxygen-independent coproporphyrinogen III oxidase [Halomonas cerina]|uniref:Coproporphyrinogen-III oxidase n=1 Tax=Halomonas cerina TaxID=447424 RepID=A0A839VFX2_9GAMM|nr:oxygen-independent coproporphyrinogen III oxidase [Halomonas cerina]MBB3191336.1 oxygen-independent coproporphyrinogen-3 oxidase [Halomonas cerina]
MPARALAVPRDIPGPVVRHAALGRRYAAPGPAYPCYPPPTSLVPQIGPADYREALERSNQAARPLSLYVHVPFCRQACFHCTRRPVTTTHHRHVEPYLSRLDREMVLTARHLDKGRQVEHLHWGGGTPTFLSLDQMGDLIDRLDARFGLSSARDRDYVIEIDPREADVFTLRHLEALGFNRLRLGVLDLDPRVQRAINRVQPAGLTEQLVDEADRLGFRALDMDLVVGLPCQTRAGFADTLEQVLALAPSRLTLAHYAHAPERFALQRQVRKADLLEPLERLAILEVALARLEAAGYVRIGLDRFVRPGLAAASSPLPARDRIGLGVSAMSRLAGLYTRNPVRLTDYEAALDQGRLPTTSGRWLSPDDRLRAAAIEGLTRDLRLDLDTLGASFGVDARAHLADALVRLRDAEQEGLVAYREQRLGVTRPGQLALRHLAAAFDAYRS